mgnify:CR=1 FL=1
MNDDNKTDHNDNQLSEEDKALLLDHNYDGIQELDYPLPRWWLVTFWGAILFSIPYFIYFVFMNGPSLNDSYNMDVKEIKKLQHNYFKELAIFKPEVYASISQTPEMVDFGEKLFVQNCTPCHGPNAEGYIGPNLTDGYWMYSEGTPETVYPFVLMGAPAAGMPAWADKLSEDEVYAVISYVMTIQGREQVNPKIPQGEFFPSERLPEPRTLPSE